MIIALLAATVVQVCGTGPNIPHVCDFGTPDCFQSQETPGRFYSTPRNTLSGLPCVVGIAPPSLKFSIPGNIHVLGEDVLTLGPSVKCIENDNTYVCHGPSPDKKTYRLMITLEGNP